MSIFRLPEFNLYNQLGELVTQDTFMGKKFVLYFYPKDNTSGCTKQAQEFSLKVKEFEALDFMIVGVSKDSIKSHQNFCSKQDLSIMLLSDPESLLQKEFNVWKEKSMYGRTYMGTERSTFVLNADGVVINEWRKVKVPGHVDIVLNYLLSL